jgi:hypothetical protein
MRSYAWVEVASLNAARAEWYSEILAELIPLPFATAENDFGLKGKLSIIELLSLIVVSN